MLFQKQALRLTQVACGSPHMAIELNDRTCGANCIHANLAPISHLNDALFDALGDRATDQSILKCLAILGVLYARRTSCNFSFLNQT